jgi:hypothetical protein
MTACLLYLALLYTKLGEIAFRYHTHDCFLLPESWFANVLLGVTFLASTFEAVGISLDYQTIRFGSKVRPSL